MTNKKFNALLKRLNKVNQKRKSLLCEAEEEFKKRFGVDPSEIDFDYWIDSYHYDVGYVSIEEIEEEFNKIYSEGKRRKLKERGSNEKSN